MSHKYCSPEEAFGMVIDVELLRCFLIDLDKPVLSPASTHHPLLKNFVFPRVYLRELRSLCRIYGAKLRLMPDAVSAHAAYYEGRSTTIFFGAQGEKNLIPMYSIYTDFTHELAHHIQQQIARALGFPERRFIRTVKDGLQYERAAERLAYFIHKKYFSCRRKIHHSSFNSYRSKKERDYLRRYFLKAGIPTTPDDLLICRLP